MDTSMNRIKLNDAVMYNKVDDVKSMIDDGANFIIEDLRKACISAIGYGFIGILEAIFTDKRYIFLAGDILDDAARLGKVEAVEYLLSFKPEWTKCVIAFGTAKQKDHKQICDLIEPFCNPPKGFPGT